MNINHYGRTRRPQNAFRFTLNAPADQLQFLTDYEYEVLYRKLDNTLKDYLNEVMPRKSFACARDPPSPMKAPEPVLAAPDFDLSLLYDLDEEPSDPILKAIIEQFPNVHCIDLGRPFDGVDTSIPK